MDTVCSCVTCHIVVLRIQADTGRTTALLLGLSGRWGWSWRSPSQVVVVEVGDGFEDVAPAWREGGEDRRRKEDSRGESRPLFVVPHAFKHHTHLNGWLSSHIYTGKHAHTEAYKLQHTAKSKGFLPPGSSLNRLRQGQWSRGLFPPIVTLPLP